MHIHEHMDTKTHTNAFIWTNYRQTRLICAQVLNNAHTHPYLHTFDWWKPAQCGCGGAYWCLAKSSPLGLAWSQCAPDGLETLKIYSMVNLQHTLKYVHVHTHTLFTKLQYVLLGWIWLSAHSHNSLSPKNKARATCVKLSVLLVARTLFLTNTRW